MVDYGTHIHVHVCTVLLPCCYALLAVMSPLFLGELPVQGYFTSNTRPSPPRAAQAGLWYCSSCTCTRVACAEELYSCIKRVENSLRTGLGLYH